MGEVCTRVESTVRTPTARPCYALRAESSTLDSCRGVQGTKRCRMYTMNNTGCGPPPTDAAPHPEAPAGGRGRGRTPPDPSVAPPTTRGARCVALTSNAHNHV